MRVEIGPIEPVYRLSCEFRIYDGNEDDDEDFMIRGWVKWDGCINWETNNGCMAHFCEPNQADALAVAFREAWNGCGSVMGDKYIGDVA